MPDIAIADADRPDADRTVELERENAALRRQLAERTAERDEALAQQTAPPRCCRLSMPRPATSRRYSTRCWRRRIIFVRPISAASWFMTAISSARLHFTMSRLHSRN